MSTGHTPGPWRESEYEDIDGPTGNHAVWPSGSGFIVARIYNTPAGNIEANARLIAAAPDLYEALAMVKGQIMFTEFEDYVLDAIDKALAKATGEGVNA